MEAIKPESNKSEEVQEVVKKQTEGVLRLSADTIKTSELRELGSLIQNFIKVSELTKTLSSSGFYKEGGDGTYFDFIEAVPDAIFKNDESMKAFLLIVENVTGIDVENEEGMQVMHLIDVTLDFLTEVHMFAFLGKLTSALTKLIRG